MAEHPTGEAHAESEVSESEEEPTERRRKNSKEMHLVCAPWEVLGLWDPGEINAEELYASILEHAKQGLASFCRLQNS